MLLLSNYNTYIFDCDGVILDSNQLKIDAMETVLSSLFKDRKKIKKCVSYFKNNFGKSRFHHVDVFLDNVLIVDELDKLKIREKILSSYSLMCKKLYLEANLTPGFIEFITSLKGKKFVASGSAQDELRAVFKERGLNVYFDGIFGSPTAKVDLIASILESVAPESKTVMFGDAMSDLDAAVANNTDFIAYIPLSNVKEKLTIKSAQYNFKIINNWMEL